MTFALCFNCGSVKHGSFTPCSKCNLSPTTDEEFAHSLALSDHYFPLQSLNQMSERVRQGAKIELLPGELEKLLPAAREARRMLGFASVSMAKRRVPAKRFTMRGLLKAYLWIGAVISVVTWVSYSAPPILDPRMNPSNASLYERIAAATSIQPIALAYSLPRVVTWGPGLLVWFIAPGDYSFGKWIAPGAYWEKVSPAAGLSPMEELDSLNDPSTATDAPSKKRLLELLSRPN